MRRFLTLGLMALALLLAVDASAQSAAAAKAPAFKKAPTFTEIGLKLNASGAIVGLQPAPEHPDDTKIFLTGHGTLTVDCFDPSATLLGEATASFSTVQGIQYIPDSQLRSSGTTFGVTTAAPGLTPEQAGCPTGATYTAAKDTTYTTARVVVIQDGLTTLNQVFDL
ncbi:MAG: hypothetical protein AVDCRST_MAG73-168 [uncultured Thermomicrobiales bacterium]|uniref:Uncharacterized protein n=1 Tax=uncultured Thermomicrobiales bacterium TaxID=1645740 RepID=A0A6J4TEU0_9BACT|nr:MAG: hypothetical protein AVDCRST_MAG73-168 [uncultured Thermomicrobiales bacterium]